MKLAIGGDHAGFPLKGLVIELLRAQGYGNFVRSARGSRYLVLHIPNPYRVRRRCTGVLERHAS
jgi:hypothetical protein